MEWSTYILLRVFLLGNFTAHSAHTLFSIGSTQGEIPKGGYGVRISHL